MNELPLATAASPDLGARARDLAPAIAGRAREARRLAGAYGLSGL